MLEYAGFSSDGVGVVTASRDTKATVWNANTGAAIADLAGHKGPVMRAEFSPDGRQVVTASSDKTAKVWDAANGSTIATLEGHTGMVLSAARPRPSSDIYRVQPRRCARADRVDRQDGSRLGCQDRRTARYPRRS